MEEAFAPDADGYPTRAGAVWERLGELEGWCFGLRAEE